jgi:hypothetical protein
MRTGNAPFASLGVLSLLFAVSPARTASGSLLAPKSSAHENASTDNPPARIARIRYLKGNVSFLRAGLDQWSQATLNFPVTTGNRAYTGKDSRAELEVGDYAVRLSESPDLTVTNLNDQIMQLGVNQGTLRVSIFELRSGNTVEVDTPNGALTMLEKGAYRIDVDTARTVVRVNSGSLQLSEGSVLQTLRAGEAVNLYGQNPVQVTSIPMLGLDSFDRWCEERDHRLAAAKSTKYVSPFTPGCEDLDEIGWRTG